jgi:hypothetical protein
MNNVYEQLFIKMARFLSGPFQCCMKIRLFTNLLDSCLFTC